MSNELRVARGFVTVLRLFDIAYAVNLAEAEARALQTEPAARARLRRPKEKAIAYSEPPLEIGLGTVDLSALGIAVEAAITARLHAFGVLTFVVRVPVSTMPWPEYSAFAATLEASLLGPHAAGWWAARVARIGDRLTTALERPTRSNVEEEYMVLSVEQFSEPLTAAALQQRIDLAALLAGEEGSFAPEQRASLLRHRLSYFDTDLVALGYDRAFVYDREGDGDVVAVLEVANAQLLELRYYNARLDTEIPRMYDRMQAARTRFGALARRRYADLARSLQEEAAEVTEITARADNALVVTEDVYLAHLYASALSLFRVDTWADGVRTKLALVRDAYQALYDEAATTRAEYLEIAIVALILFEIVWTLVQH
jgi:hypothetical protein